MNSVCEYKGRLGNIKFILLAYYNFVRDTTFSYQNSLKCCGHKATYLN
jgi:hypothetical protein